MMLSILRSAATLLLSFSLLAASTPLPIASVERGSVAARDALAQRRHARDFSIAARSNVIAEYMRRAGKSMDAKREAARSFDHYASQYGNGGGHHHSSGGGGSSSSSHHGGHDHGNSRGGNSQAQHGREGQQHSAGNQGHHFKRQEDTIAPRSDDDAILDARESRTDTILRSIRRRAAEDLHLRSRARSLDERASQYSGGQFGPFVPLGGTGGKGAAQAGQGATGATAQGTGKASGQGTAQGAGSTSQSGSAQGTTSGQTSQAGQGADSASQSQGAAGGIGQEIEQALGGLLKGIGLKERTLDDAVSELERALDHAGADPHVIERDLGSNVGSAVNDLGTSLGQSVDDLTGALGGGVLKKARSLGGEVSNTVDEDERDDIWEEADLLVRDEFDS